jgi:hypothetical protein
VWVELVIAVLSLVLLGSLSLNFWFIRRTWQRFIYRA